VVAGRVGDSRTRGGNVGNLEVDDNVQQPDALAEMEGEVVGCISADNARRRRSDRDAQDDTVASRSPVNETARTTTKYSEAGRHDLGE
jgi:hypothetical protein